jgi:hypothetical protein
VPSDKPAAEGIPSLDDMNALLVNGPILIGEYHDAKPGRQRVNDLLDAGCVKFLSIESPIAPEVFLNEDGQLTEEHSLSYFSATDSKDNNFLSVKTLAQKAMGLGVKVYFHDMPAIKSQLAAAVDPHTLGEQNPYIIQATQFITPKMNMPKLPQLDLRVQGLAVWKRNMYSACYIKSKLGDDVYSLSGLVLLVGDAHAQSDKCGGPKGTIQHMLGIAENRVFHFGY